VAEKCICAKIPEEPEKIGNGSKLFIFFKPETLRDSGETLCHSAVKNSLLPV